MKRRLEFKDALTVRLPEPTLNAINALAAAGDISASTIAAALLANHIDDLRQMTSLANEARGTVAVRLDEVYDLLAHLWLETALDLAAAAGDEFPWKTNDEKLRAQWAADLAVFRLRKRLNAMRRHEVESDG